MGGGFAEKISEESTNTEGKEKEQFRDYEAEVRPEVKEFYRLNHKHQTLDFAISKKEDFTQLNRRKMTVWEAIEFLNELIDDSDPDIELPQIEHILQTAEAIRKGWSSALVYSYRINS